MERLILNKLLEWKNSPYRKPLILKGVRQVGKTWILQNLMLASGQKIVPQKTLNKIYRISAPGLPGSSNSRAL
jgi:predicted AAA+ superfamily ATPase